MRVPFFDKSLLNHNTTVVFVLNADAINSLRHSVMDTSYDFFQRNQSSIIIYNIPSKYNT